MPTNPPAPLLGEDLQEAAQTLIQSAAAKGLKIAVAESCTGGLVAALLTEVPGSSAVLDRGFVTYSNEAKQDMLGVPANLLTHYGAVSAPVARAMAEGAIAHSLADIAVAITGIAGPGGGSPDKPVGLVHFALACRGQPTQNLERRFGDPGRSPIRILAVNEALNLFQSVIDKRE